MRTILATLVALLSMSAGADGGSDVLREHQWPLLTVPNRAEACFKLGFHIDQSTSECWLSTVEFDANVLRRYASLATIKDLANDSIYSRLIVRFEDHRIKTYIVFPGQPRNIAVFKAFPNRQTLERLIQRATELGVAERVEPESSPASFNRNP